MKNIICICIVLCLNSGLAFADSSKMTKVDLDVKTTNIVKADLGRDDLVYYMDTTACLCWISQSMGSSFAVSVFDCSKLVSHPKLEKYAMECGGVKKEVPFEQAPVVKEEVKKEEPKKEVQNKEEVKKEDVKKEDVKQTESTSTPMPETEDKTKDAAKTTKDTKKTKK